ncbi:Retrovirus-related Pol polyprotein from transposon TNT 1-94 [Vitis vinifera]|uniref:Retrovirus-related Pol polyprotein from transposon TNT 1-94 n=1 Tax=Vitis vinifera TaxID=29760 RepID=A0A438D2Q4_VITVI|nr:Retrovirus-related Pol polyprotein from transposon TNT 1-94 [Vitis vinifera]
MEGETIKIMNQDLVRLDRFDGSNFTRWQDNVRFLLTALKIFYILDPTLALLPEPKENDTPQVVAARKKREEDELICRGHILNALSDRLYDPYTNTYSAREIWEALENKYKAEEEVIVNKLKVLKIELPEAFQVGAIMAKLPSSWKVYRKRILHKSEDYSLEEIQKHLRIEEESRSRDKTVEESNGGLTKPMRFQRPIILEGKKGSCFVCGKPEHYARECRYRKDLKGAVVNAIDEEIIATLSDVPLKMQKEIKRFKWAMKEDPSGYLLGKPGIKAVFESGKLILSKSGNFVGKGLAHVECGLIACDTKKFEKCEICVKSKMIKKPFHSVEGSSNLLDLIHSDLCELNDMLTRGGNRKPNIGYFKVWGCLAYCKKTDPHKKKLGLRAIKCAFVGYASNSKAYRLLDLESNVIIESREVEFFENLLSDSNSQVPTSVGESLEETPSKVVEQPIVPRKSQRARKEKVLGSDEIDSQRISFYLVEGNREDIIRKIPIVLQIEEDPKTYKEVMASRDVAFWKEAINDEMDSILSNQTWELVDLPSGSKPIGCKWVFRRKYHTDGMIQTFKARLVAKGFKQREGIDYFDTYAPVARTTSIRILFALASIHNLSVHQMDVKMAFLNGDLNEEVYMEQPEVCLYVDDMLILSDDMKGIIETKRFLSSTFKMKDLGEVDTILGIKVKRNSGGYALNQNHYIEKVVSKFSHLKIKDANTPFDSSIKLEKNDVSKLSRFISNPSVEHWKVIARVLGYLKNTKELSLQYSKFPAILEGYSDASWISSVRDNLSTIGWVFTLGGGAVSWGSKKQTCISHTTMETEFIALAATGKEAEWLRDLMMDIPFTANNVSTVSIHCDSQATLARAYSGVYNGKSRHISIRHEYVRQLIRYGIFSISFVRSSGNLADPFTKPLTRDLVRITSRGMGLKLLK